MLQSFRGLKELIIVIDSESNFEIKPRLIPMTVEKLTIMVADRFFNTYKYDGTLVVGSIPLSVTTAKLEHRLFNHDPHNLLPESLTNLVVKRLTYTRCNDLLFPNTVRMLFLESDGHPITEDLLPGCFPDSIEVLDFQRVFSPLRVLVPGVIPNRVREVSLGSYEKKLTPGVIPESAVNINLGNFFYPFIDVGVIPSGAKNLKFNHHGYTSDEYYELDPAFIPQSVESIISITGFLKQPHLNHLDKITRLSVTKPYFQKFSKFPPMIEYLECEVDSIKIGLLPNRCLHTLILKKTVLEIEPGSIPDTVHTLHFLDTIKINIQDKHVPPHLKELKLGGPFQAPQFPVIPNGVLKLIIEKGDYIPKFRIPQSVESIEFGKQFIGHLIEGVLPTTNLKSLHFGDNTPLDHIVIPICVNFLETEYQEDTTFFKLISTLFLRPDTQIKSVKLSNNLTLVSLGFNDDFIYYINKTTSMEGFIKKTRLFSQLIHMNSINEKTSNLFSS
eukprot:gene3944-4926_t